MAQSGTCSSRGSECDTRDLLELAIASTPCHNHARAVGVVGTPWKDARVKLEGVPEPAMRIPSTFTGLFHSDPDYAPFGIDWLRGLTPARIGLVVAFCAVFTLRQYDPANLSISDNLRYLMTQVLCYVPMLVLVTVADNVTSRTSNRRRMASLGGAVIVGAVVYVALYLPFLHLLGTDPSWLTPAWLLSYFNRALLYGGLLTALLYFITRERAVQAALHATQLTKLTLDRQMTEARLQALQAQIEPHFLFNTLANIKRLYHVDQAHGKRMIRDLSDYFLAALPQMRESSSTLRRELAMVQAYVNVFKVRMGTRLNFKVAAPPALLEASLPPMMLLTLVENAIKHGLGPLPRGGTVSINAVQDRGRLRIEVADDGAGLSKTSGPGIGLANTRARLTTLYGAEAKLDLRPNATGGVTTSIELPFLVRNAGMGRT
jgi:signal transduction histidine kinase